MNTLGAKGELARVSCTPTIAAARDTLIPKGVLLCKVTARPGARACRTCERSWHRAALQLTDCLQQPGGHSYPCVPARTLPRDTALRRAPMRAKIWPSMAATQATAAKHQPVPASQGPA